MFEVTTSDVNKDANFTREQYRTLFSKGGFTSKLVPPEFYPAPERDDIFILDFGKGQCGLKAYGAEKLIAEIDPSTPMGYAAPRVGHAAEAIAYLAQLYGKTAVFFAPASKQVTAHQAIVTAYGAELRFAKIPAMPTLNAWIRGWAQKNNGVALPFGLANIKEVTAGLVNLCDRHTSEYGEPTEFYCAVSTGTMIRALQIGWPNATAKGTAVARNIKEGEKGYGDVVSAKMGFYRPSDYLPEFNTTANYDAKAYKRFIDEGEPGAIFINVGSDEQIERNLKLIPGWENMNGRRKWGDLSAFEEDL